VVFPDMSKAAAYRMAEDIRMQINETPYLSDYGHNIHVGISLGLASFPEDAEDSHELLTLADGALFQIKASGKNGVAMVD
jgi:diguanylate cyclase (GGDEF)-like protein